MVIYRFPSFFVFASDKNCFKFRIASCIAFYLMKKEPCLLISIKLCRTIDMTVQKEWLLLFD